MKTRSRAIHRCIYIHNIYTYICTYIEIFHTYTHTHIYICICICIYIYIYMGVESCFFLPRYVECF